MRPYLPDSDLPIQLTLKACMQSQRFSVCDYYHANDANSHHAWPMAEISFADFGLVRYRPMPKRVGSNFKPIW